MITFKDSQGNDVVVKHYTELNSGQQEKIKLLIYKSNTVDNIGFNTDTQINSKVADFIGDLLDTYIYSDSITKYDFDIEGTNATNVTVSFKVHDSAILQLLSEQHRAMLSTKYDDIDIPYTSLEIFYNTHSSKPQFIINNNTTSIDEDFQRDLLRHLEEDIDKNNEKLMAINDFAKSVIQKELDDLYDEQIGFMQDTPVYTSIENLRENFDTCEYYFYDDCNSFNCDDKHIYKIPFLGGTVEYIL
jgi:hypothetical protein